MAARPSSTVGRDEMTQIVVFILGVYAASFVFRFSYFSSVVSPAANPTTVAVRVRGGSIGTDVQASAETHTPTQHSNDELEKYLQPNKKTMARTSDVANSTFFSSVDKQAAANSTEAIIRDGLIGIDAQSPLSRAMTVVRNYIKKHSEYELEKEFHLNHENSELGISTAGDLFGGRRFAIAYYSCPYQAGNRLHHFMNAVVWSMVTNRTLLWKYYDRDTCRKVGRKYDPSICLKTGEKQMCDTVLPLREWIPSYDKWAPLLGLSAPTRVSYWSTHMPRNGTVRSKAATTWKEGDEKWAGIDLSREDVLDFGQLLGNDAVVLEPKRNREYLLQSSYAQITAESLLSAQHNFLYGLLFERLFSFNYTLAPAMHSPLPDQTHPVISIAVHSRHSKNTDDGSNVEREVACLKKVLPGSSRPCIVYIISDRPASLKRIKDATQEMNCTPVLPHHNEDKSFRKEHGPYAGVGFFQDLVVASQARHGLVGAPRSSTMLLEERITYQRKVEEFANGGTSSGQWHHCQY